MYLPICKKKYGPVAPAVYFATLCCMLAWDKPLGWTMIVSLVTALVLDDIVPPELRKRRIGLKRGGRIYRRAQAGTAMAMPTIVAGAQALNYVMR